MSNAAGVRRSRAKLIHNLLMSLPLGPGDRRGPRRARQGGVGSRVEKKTHERAAAPPGGDSQRRRSILVVDRVDVRAMIDQQTRLRQLAVGGHVMQQREAMPG